MDRTISQRVARYRSSLKASRRVRVEVSVHVDDAAAVKEFAASLTMKRQEENTLDALVDRALSVYSVRILDNIDLSRLGREDVARVVGHALIERCDARGFFWGRKILAIVDSKDRQDRLPGALGDLHAH